MSAAELASIEDRFGVDIDVILARASQIELAAALQGDEALQVRARLLQANMHRRRGDLARAARMAWQAMAWAEEHGDRSLTARSHQVVSAVYDNLGDTATGLDHAVRAVEFLDDDTTPRARAVMLVKLADDLAMSGSIDAARQRYQQAEQIADAPDVLRTVLNNFAYAEYLSGSPQRAWDTMQRLRAAGESLSPDAIDTLARIQIALGRYSEAAATAAYNVDAHAWSATDDADDLAEFLLTLAVAQRHQGDPAAAQESLDRCAALCRDRDLGGTGVRVREEQAELHAARGEFALAFAAHKDFHAAERQLISRQREEQARTRHAMFETEEARREAERFREQARQDALTGLPNRRYVDERLPVLLAAAGPDHPVTVAMLDLDHFKRVNDQCSHEVGDRVLARVAEILRGSALVGFAARLGGEEFLVALPGTDQDEAVRQLDQLRGAVAAHDWGPLTGDLPVTVSVGAATTTDPGRTPAEMLAEADAHLYAAKRGGRNRVVADSLGSDATFVPSRPS